MHNLRNQHKIALLCRVLRVNRSTYYKHFYSATTPRTNENNILKQLILRIYSEHKNILGGKKIQHLLLNEYGIKVSLKRVYRLKNTMALPTIATKKPKFKYFSQDESCCHNHLDQKFNQKNPNIVWVGDITYLNAGSKWYYLAVVIDLFSRKVVGYKLSKVQNTELVKAAFQNAYFERCPTGLMFHSDRGTQYTALQFRQLLDNCNVVQSFSRKGHPFDNAVAECFFKYLKLEWIGRRTYLTLQELELAVFEYINYYNSKRPHSSLNYNTPNGFENAHILRTSPKDMGNQQQIIKN